MNKRLNQDASRSRRGLTIAALATAALATGASAAGAAEAPFADAPVFSREEPTEEARRFEQDRRDYDRLFEKARKLDVEPKRNTSDQIARDFVLEAKLETLRKDVRKETQPEYGTPESVGVSQSTLDAIAACESGGDPTVVDASGTYYGKYQFDLGTWASVGGSGSPAEAPEAEQDYRAALLMSQAGSSPWPVCG